MARNSTTPLLATSLALVTLVGAAAAAVLHAGSDGAAATTFKMHLRTGGSTEALELTDLDELEVGESREYATASGTPVTVTRDDDGYALELDGRTIRIGGEEGLGHAGHPGMKMRRIELDGDGQRIVLSGDPHERRVIVHRGENGESGFAFTDDLRGPHAGLFHHGLLARMERSEKFQALDEVTQEIVRELVREAAPSLLHFDAEAPGEDAVELWIERRTEGEGKP
jgi:hypothetical protein